MTATIDTTGTPLGDLLLKVEDTAWPSDREFFKASPHRKLRLRPAFNAEVNAFYAVAGITPKPLPPGQCWWVIVRQFLPGIRMRFPFPAKHDIPPDPPEKICKDVYRLLCKNVREVRDMERDFLRKMKHAR